MMFSFTGAPARRHDVRTLLRVITIALASFAVTVAQATDIRVRPYEDITALSRTAKPGDNVLIYPGTFGPSVVEGVHGEPGRPITFRNAPASPAPAEFDARNAEYGLQFIDCSHIRIENVVVKNASGAGLLIEGVRAPSEDVSIDLVGVARSEASDKGCGVVLRNTLAVRITRLRVSGWSRAALLIESSHDVSLDGGQFAGVATLPQRSGVEIVGPSSDVSVSHCWFRAAQGVGFMIGASSAGNAKSAAPSTTNPASTASAATLEPAVDRCTISVVRVDDCAGLLAIGSVARLDVSQCTLINARKACWSVLAPATGFAQPTGRIANSIFTWQVGAIQQLSPVAEGANASGLELDHLLFWSKELSAMKEHLGSLAGTEKGQILWDLDPNLDDAGYAKAEGAAGLGMQRSKKPPAALTPKTPSP